MVSGQLKKRGKRLGAEVPSPSITYHLPLYSKHETGMNYGDCLKYLDSLGQEMHGLQWGLETITKVLAGLGNPHLKYPTAIVAGTNGKGSTAAMLASILREAGYRTGLYTSLRFSPPTPLTSGRLEPESLSTPCAER